MALEGAAPVYLNRALWLEFLDRERWRVSGADNFEENLFICLSSAELAASVRVHAIIYIAVIMPLRWLASHSH
eukprot:3741549-Pleurochrysis_carterae.AAC.2